MAKSIVILDPGHGGKDSGAVGCGHKEKDDVLKLAKAVGKLIKPYVTVKYTRTTDKYDAPSQKAAIANKHPKAKLFISLHRNDYNAQSNGFEVDVRGNAGIKKKYASYVRKRMTDEVGYKDRGTVERDNLAVLNRTVMPAVLNEVGFMKNKKDTELFVKKFDWIAEIIADGILYALDIKKKEPVEKKGFTEGSYEKNVQITKDCPVRTGRGKAYKKLGTLKVGTKVKVLYILKNVTGNLWGSIDYGSGVGYIYLGNCGSVK